MAPQFPAVALSRLDGSSADGIHLLFQAPGASGYSIKGFDIQRRQAHGRKPRQRCHELTPTELKELYSELHVAFELGTLEVRLAECPRLPERPPDEPHHEGTRPTRRCVRFEPKDSPGRPSRTGPNPLLIEDVSFEVFGRDGEPAPHTTLTKVEGDPALACGAMTRVVLPLLATAVELTIAAPTPAVVVAIGADGRRSQARTRGDGKLERVFLKGKAIERVEIHAKEGPTSLLELCFASRGAPADRLEPHRMTLKPTADFTHSPTLAAASSATHGTDAHCLAYDLRLPEPHDLVRLELEVAHVYAIAFSGDKAVATASSTSGTVAFLHRAVDRVVAYAGAVARKIVVCVDVPVSPKEEEAEWAHVPYLAKHIQMPVRAIDAALHSPADEEALAESRLLAGESFEPASFAQATELFNAAATRAEPHSPAWMTTLSREDVKDQFVELRSWAYGLALTLDPTWRRMLGLAYLDPGAGLTAGTTYEYRITGRFRRRDLEEQLHGFHTVPSGTTLPRWFDLGGVSLDVRSPKQVAMLPEASASDLSVTGRKGIALHEEGPSGTCLRLSFPEPVQRVVLELEPGHELSFRASTSDYLPGLGGSTFSRPVEEGDRVTIEFEEPVDTVQFEGSGFLYGIRTGLDPELDPEEVVAVSVVAPPVRYETTPDPEPPPFLGTLNLQEPPAPGPPETNSQPPPPLGFKLLWLPPSAAGPEPWSAELPATPPLDVLGFQLERRRVDTGGSFVDIDENEPPTLLFGNRGARAKDPPPLQDGIDLLEAFPEAPQPEPPVPLYIEIDDPLRGPGEGGPPPGSLHQYRVRSVDATGRRSAPTDGSVCRLEKHQPPPQPAGPQREPDSRPGAPAGVTARVLQAADPDLSEADRELLGERESAVAIEWGWTKEQRERDPYATEFRLYWQSQPPDSIGGELTGATTAAGANWEMQATMERSVAANALAGRHVLAGEHAFRVASNTEGTAITIVFEPSNLDASAEPQPARFDFQPTLDGSELRPANWEERVEIVPIGSDDTYTRLIERPLGLDAEHPTVRVWVGVSAADGQTYVSDELPESAPEGGRDGNESSIAVALAFGRYVGRPVFSAPEPLADVPELLSAEPAGDSVNLELDLPELLTGVPVPAGHTLQVERLALSELASRLEATAADEIATHLPDGSTDVYSLADPEDQEALLAELRGGIASAVETKYLMDALIRHAAAFETTWTAALAQPVPLEAVTIALPGKPERHAVRVRLVDPAGHSSAEAAILPKVVRVPSLRAPAAPSFQLEADETDAVTVSARVHDQFDLEWLLVFATSAEAGAAIDEATSGRAQLLRLPNRQDLYPDDGVRLRLADGTLLAPTAVAASSGVEKVPDRLVTAVVSPGFDKQVTVWTASMTRDGVPSKFAGPSVALTGPQPLVVPALSVTAAEGTDRAAWATPTVPAQAALQRSEDGGTSWTQVSPWLPETKLEHELPGTGSRLYRLVLRGTRGREATGTEVAPS